jgi:flagellar motor switch/type III secretory pathway protein FliN
VACTPFDWHQSHYFTPEQLERLQAAAIELVKAQESALSQLCGGAIEMTLTGVTQEYASVLLDRLNAADPSPLFQAFGRYPGEALGALMLTPESARVWVSLLMGPSEGDGSDTAFSEFELSLLGDVTNAAIRSWAQLGEDYRYAPHAQGIGIGLSMPWDRASHLCQIACTLSRKTEDEDEVGERSEACFVLPCEALAPLAKKTTNTQQAHPEQLTEAIKHHLLEYPVRVSGEVGRTMLRFHELMELREQDVVVLDRSIHDPIDVMVAGRSVFRAFAGQCQGRQALKIANPNQEPVS